MRVTIHKDHGVTLEDIDDQLVQLFVAENGHISVTINCDDDDGDDDDESEPDSCWSDAMLGRN
jgi:hypothetical protein